MSTDSSRGLMKRNLRPRFKSSLGLYNLRVFSTRIPPPLFPVETQGKMNRPQKKKRIKVCFK